MGTLFSESAWHPQCIQCTGIHCLQDSFLTCLTEVIFEGLERFTAEQTADSSIKAQIGGVTIIDDYAHHPTEIEATLHAAKNYPHKKIWCVFQPHTYTRTKALLPEFAKALTLADHVVLADIYAAQRNG